MHYRLTDTEQVIRFDDDGTFMRIPNDPLNYDWVAYQKWLKDGNTPDPEPQPHVEEEKDV